LVRPFSPALASKLDAVYYPPVAEVFLGYRSDQCLRPLDGFGYLIPAREKREILGTIWSSVLFPNRAPAKHVALTTFVGGSRQPEKVDLGDRDLINLVVQEIQSIMNVRGQPVFARVARWTKAIPQYHLGHFELYKEIDRLESSEPGLFLCGNYRGGIAVGDCIMNGKKTADNVLAMLALARAGVRQEQAHSE
jgi:oxygen-dependent protoporphyrinogen oxidase